MNEENEKAQGNILHSFKSKRGTFIEMIQCPTLGIACYMDHLIQSCEYDEKIYHQALVSSVMNHKSNSKNVMIIGGVEGASAREVLKDQSVARVDMYEWDEEVVELFKKYYPQWAMGAWDDDRLHLYYDDIFDVIRNPPRVKYDIIIIDLFDPSNETEQQLIHLLTKLQSWLSPNGSLVMYAGMYETQKENAFLFLSKISTENWYIYPNHLRTVYSVPIESFSGDCMFLMLTNPYLKEEKLDENEESDGFIGCETGVKIP